MPKPILLQYAINFVNIHLSPFKTETIMPTQDHNTVLMSTASKKYADNQQTLIDAGRKVVEIESQALSELLPRIDQNFARACMHILNCQGSLIITGMGKSGHIARKIAATFASTGTPAFFMHPGEASHGDLGMITTKDVVIALSNSGETAELVVLLPAIKRLDIPLITMTGNEKSQLAKYATVHIDIGVKAEACPLGLAPTASTIAALAMGDALAISILQAKGFTSEDFAFSHPGGKLGKRLLLKVADVMFTGDAIPIVTADVLLPDAIIEVSKKRLGMTTVVEHANSTKIVGVFTDGDLRRVLEKKIDIHSTKLAQVISTKFKTIKADVLASEAAHIMETNKITALPVLDEHGNIVGALNIHNLFQAGVL